MATERFSIQRDHRHHQYKIAFAVNVVSGGCHSSRLGHNQDGFPIMLVNADHVDEEDLAVAIVKLLRVWSDIPRIQTATVQDLIAWITSCIKVSVGEFMKIRDGRPVTWPRPGLHRKFEA